MSFQPRFHRSARCARRTTCGRDLRLGSWEPRGCWDRNPEITHDPRRSLRGAACSAHWAARRRANSRRRCCRPGGGSRKIGERCADLIKFGAGLRVRGQMSHHAILIRPYRLPPHPSRLSLGQLPNERDRQPRSSTSSLATRSRAGTGCTVGSSRTSPTRRRRGSSPPSRGPPGRSGCSSGRSTRRCGW